MNITSFSRFQSGLDADYSSSDNIGSLRVQDVGEGTVKIRLYERRIARGPLRGTPVMFKVYPGQRAGGIEADEVAANELNAHASLQSSSKGIFQNLVTLVGGFETTTGEQEETIQLGRYFVIKLLRGAINGLVFMHDNDRLHPSLGLSSIVLNTIAERAPGYLAPQLWDLAFSFDIRLSNIEDSRGTLSEGLLLLAPSHFWRKGHLDLQTTCLLIAYMAFVPFCEAGIIDSLSLQRLLENTFQLDLEAMREYCTADNRLLDCVKFLDLGNGPGWELLQAMLNPDFRKRLIAEAVLNHRFLSGAAVL